MQNELGQTVCLSHCRNQSIHINLSRQSKAIQKKSIAYRINLLKHEINLMN